MLATILVCAGCQAGRADAVSREASKLSQAVRALRDAPNDQKRPELERLVKTECTAPDLCNLRETCVEGYRQHLRALDRARSVSGILDTDTQAAARALASAERELGAAHDRVSECARVEAAIRRKYRL